MQHRAGSENMARVHCIPETIDRLPSPFTLIARLAAGRSMMHEPTSHERQACFMLCAVSERLQRAKTGKSEFR
eukprot:scaffold119918_cov69-Phaeocystis_antarctica.AAC.3